MRNRVMELMIAKMAEEQRKITDKELATAINLAPSGVTRWMRNEITEFKADTIDALCRYFKCQVGDLLVLVDDNGKVVKWE